MLGQPLKHPDETEAAADPLDSPYDAIVILPI
jgi:hypothetical protein